MSSLRLRRGFSRCQQWLMLFFCGHWFKKPLGAFIQQTLAFFKANTIIDDGGIERRAARRVQEPTFAPLPSDSVEGWNSASSRVTAEIQQSVLPGPPAVIGTAARYRSSEPTVDRLTTAPSEPAGIDSFLVLYVTAHQRDRIYGEPLLRSLLQLGFRHGERSVFHRHLNPLGSGPILFSLVNRVKPGTFTPSTMGEFTTPGVALCMSIPAYGDTIQNFKLMVQAAQRLADDVGGVVLDDNCHLWTLETSEHYKARIRRLLAAVP